MSKTGQWFLEMHEDAIDMTKEEFISEHGKGQVHIWEEVQEKMDIEFSISEQKLDELYDTRAEPSDMALEDFEKIQGGY
tara:strand:+ start:198 stop:434 length:237 start_codon:yes stop_codon:yes gene_type:complete